MPSLAAAGRSWGGCGPNQRARGKTIRPDRTASQYERMTSKRSRFDSDADFRFVVLHAVFYSKVVRKSTCSRRQHLTSNRHRFDVVVFSFLAGSWRECCCPSGSLPVRPDQSMDNNLPSSQKDMYVTSTEVPWRLSEILFHDLARAHSEPRLTATAEGPFSLRERNDWRNHNMVISTI